MYEIDRADVQAAHRLIRQSLGALRKASELLDLLDLGEDEDPQAAERLRARILALLANGALGRAELLTRLGGSRAEAWETVQGLARDGHVRTFKDAGTGGRPALRVALVAQDAR